MHKEDLLFLFSYLKRSLPPLIVSLVLSVFISALTLAIPYLVGQSIDLLIGPDQVDFGKLSLYGMWIALSGVGVGISQFFSGTINNRISFRLTQRLRDDLNEKIHRLPLSYLDNQQTGDILNRMIADVEAIAEGLILEFNQLFSNAMTIVATLTIMFVIHYRIALVVFLLTPLSLFVARFISRSTYRLFRKQSEIKAKQTGFVNEMIGSMKVVQAFRMEEENSRIFGEINADLEKSSISAVFFSSLVNPSTRFINALIYAGVTLAGAFICLSAHPMKIGTLTAFLSYVNQYTKPFNEITGVIGELQNSFASASRVRDLLSRPEETQEGNLLLERVEGSVTLDRVDFSYTSEVSLIQNLSLEIKPGTKVAIVGPTGCGKTTLINLLMRFYDPDSGSIRLDAKDIRTLQRHSLRDAYGMVLQDTWLKEGTIRDNVKMGKEDATDEEIRQALKESHCLSFVEQMPSGIDSLIKENGDGLSQGQKQLLSVSRIMLTRPPLLILDEATSSIDTRTEVKIQEAFNRLMEGKTSFIVAHRLSTIRNADLILVMNRGNVIEKGNHEELMAKKGFYYDLYNSQFKQ